MKSSFYREEETKEKLAEFILKAPILSMNEECWKFEEAFAKKQERKYAVFVSSGSSANLVLIQALLNSGKLKKGDKVGFSALTWSTNVMPLIQLGLVPVALDCSLGTLNVNPSELEKNISEIKGLFLTNVLGFCDDILKIRDICQRNNVVFLEDNCESLGSKISGTMLGNFGLASTFSFFVGHHISTIEGGMVCTNDEELYSALLVARIHGWDRNLNVSRQQELRNRHNVDNFYAKYTFYDLAFNARPTEIQGFLGNAQLEYWNEIVLKREGNFKLFNYVSGKNDDTMPLKLDRMELVSNFAMPVIFRNKEIFNRYKERFLENNVEIRPIIAGNMSQQPFYKKYIGISSQECKNANFIHENGFYFANNPELTQNEIYFLCNLLEKK